MPKLMGANLRFAHIIFFIAEFCFSIITPALTTFAKASAVENSFKVQECDARKA